MPARPRDRRPGAAQHLRRRAVDSGIGRPHAAQPGGALPARGPDRRPANLPPWWSGPKCPRRSITMRTRAFAATSPTWRASPIPIFCWEWWHAHAGRRAAQLGHPDVAGGPPASPATTRSTWCPSASSSPGLSISSSASPPRPAISRPARVVVSPVGGHKLGTFICYESVFPNFVRRFVADGAEVLFNISNDGYFGKSAARQQHLEIVRMRAAENRRWILRATNDGITATIDPAGRLRGTLPLIRGGRVAHRLHAISRSAPSTRGSATGFPCCARWSLSRCSLLIAVCCDRHLPPKATSKL